MLTNDIGVRVNGMEKLHIGNIVNVNMLFQHDDQPLPVELDGENGRDKGEFYYC